jgi:hypothetical protein
MPNGRTWGLWRFWVPKRFAAFEDVSEKIRKELVVNISWYGNVRVIEILLHIVVGPLLSDSPY